MSSKATERLSDIARWTGQMPQSVLTLLALADGLRAGRAFLSLLLAVGITLGFAGSSAPTDRQVRFQAIDEVIAGRKFSLVGWEFAALGEKIAAWQANTGAGLEREQARAVVLGYIEGIRRMRQAEEHINRLVSVNAPDSQVAQAQEELADLRQRQQARRPLVEAVIQRQVADVLADAGLGVGGSPVPPVNFTFTEPPQILIISPRQEIRNIRAQMLVPQIDSAEAGEKEADIAERTDFSAYITRIGGLGAYPTMVVESTNLEWVVSTVVHEWVHNYLTLFPLGMRFGSSPELTTLNETVADIVGDEVGRRVLVRYYPEFARPEATQAGQTPEQSAEPSVPLPEPDPPPFDFNREMRTTRLRVDELLAAGRYIDAEAYMEARRQVFVENGYHLRVLNQAYFAFHGSYATGGASSSPIGDQLQELQRIKTPDDIAGFLHTVRWFTSAGDLERVLGTEK
ncbi:MAG: hypothetical protein KF753_18695 [Caldilineaceae bacterium]|nr:hypothetical protein [Caldilineaceae bacterium]